MATRISARPAQRRLKSTQQRTGHSQFQTPRPASEINSLPSVDDDSTAAFVRRTLCAHRVRSAPIDPRTGRAPTPALEDLLPPLTSSNDVDLQFYAILAVIFKEAVLSWYARITPDNDFVEQVIHVIAHCTRGLEQRIRSLELETLILSDIPRLVDAHVSAYRTSEATFRARGHIESCRRGVYHSLQPHPALSPVPSDAKSILLQAENEAVWRQLLVQGVLVNLLPPEDLANPCLRVLVTEIFSEMIIANAIGGKICQGWFIWDIVLKLVRRAESEPGEVQFEQQGANAEPGSGTKTRLQDYGLVDAPTDKESKVQTRHWPKVADLSIAVLGIVSTFFTLFRRLFDFMLHFGSYPLRSSNATTYKRQPIIAMAALPLPFRLVGLDERLPWVTGLSSLLRTKLLYGFGKLARVDGSLDRFLAHQFHSRVLVASHVPRVLRIVREALFPNNTMAAGRALPDTEEITRIKTACAHALVQVVPRRFRDLYFGIGCDQENARRQVLDLLDVFGDDYMNKHLLFSILDLLICRLFPEVEESGIDELLRDRVGLPTS